MYEVLLFLSQVVGRDVKGKFFRYQMLLLLMAFFEISVIVMIGPLVKVILNPENLNDLSVWGFSFSEFFGLDVTEFIFNYSIILIVLLCFSTMVSIFTIKKTTSLGMNVGFSLGVVLFEKYIGAEWKLLKSKAHSDCEKKICIDSMLISDKIVGPIVNINNKIYFILILLVGFVLYSPLVALIVFLVIAFSYVAIYKTVRSKLYQNSIVMDKMVLRQHSHVSESFKCLKDILVADSTAGTLSEFVGITNDLARARGLNMVFSQAPRYFIETVVIIVFLLFLMLTISTNPDAAVSVLPSLAVAAFAGLKLLPAIQQVYTNYSQLKGNLASFNNVRTEIHYLSSHARPIYHKARTLVGIDEIELDKISFRYTDTFILKDLSLRAEAGKFIAIIGVSGSGKTTLMELMLGLDKPQSGTVSIRKEGKVVANSMQDMQASYISQDIYIRKGTVKDIVTNFSGDIDYDHLSYVLDQCEVTPFIDQLPAKLDTVLEQNASRLSGGQKQRIALARALYDRSGVCFLDEATSALDSVTERRVLAAFKMSGKLVVSITHRLDTLELADVVYRLIEGKLIKEDSK